MRRGRSPKRLYHPTAGGQKLRGLRERLGLTLADVEVRSDYTISVPHLQKIEIGRIQRPDYETLDLILAALSASFIDRRTVLEAFGYRASRSLPTEQEISEARQLCAHELEDATYPVYLIDDGQRLLAWNRYVPRLIGMHPDDPALAMFYGLTTIDLAFNPAYITSTLIDNPDAYLRMELLFIKAGLQAYQGESWYEELVARARSYPRFNALWDSLPHRIVEQVATQHIIPLILRVPHVGVLQFRLTNSAFVLDPRFQLIHYVPYGATTLRQCARWAEEEGVL